MNSSATVNKKDQILMQLVHYFITVENYTPIMVKGVQNEIWLENLEAPYRIIRINSNYIHNNEQLNFDLFKIKNIVKQVKRKTLSFSINTLNILLDIGNNVEMKNTNKIDCVFVDTNIELKKSKEINKLYPALKQNLLDTKDGIEFFINVTNDINKKTEKENKEFEKVFKRKNIYLTYSLIFMNILIFVLGNLLKFTNIDLYTTIALHPVYVKAGEFYRLITAAFAHESLIHLLFNMYALFIIGGQIETYLGKKKYITIYLFSALIGSLLSCVVNTGWSLGASGAIFGLMGALLYFGYHYRLYLDNALKTQIIPLICVNLLMGFMLQGIDNAAHIGGLVGGLFMALALGVKDNGSKQDKINGIICSIILLGFLLYLIYCI